MISSTRAEKEDGGLGRVSTVPTVAAGLTLLKPCSHPNGLPSAATATAQADRRCTHVVPEVVAERLAIEAIESGCGAGGDHILVAVGVRAGDLAKVVTDVPAAVVRRQVRRQDNAREPAQEEGASTGRGFLRVRWLLWVGGLPLGAWVEVYDGGRDVADAEPRVPPHHERARAALHRVPRRHLPRPRPAQQLRRLRAWGWAGCGHGWGWGRGPR